MYEETERISDKMISLQVTTVSATNMSWFFSAFQCDRLRLRSTHFSLYVTRQKASLPVDLNWVQTILIYPIIEQAKKKKEKKKRTDGVNAESCVFSSQEIVLIHLSLLMVTVVTLVHRSFVNRSYANSEHFIIVFCGGILSCSCRQI